MREEGEEGERGRQGEGRGKGRRVKRGIIHRVVGRAEYKTGLGK